MRKRVATGQQSHRQRGDTIIEVLLAIGVLSVLIVTTYTVMSRSLGSVYNSLDRTNTQAVMAGQVSMLRAAHAKFISPAAIPADKDKWRAIVENVRNVEDPTPETPTDKENRNKGCEFGVPVADAFYFNPINATFQEGMTVTKNIRNPSVGAVPTPGDGIWIEGYEMSKDSTGAVIDKVYTFYIKACTKPIYGDGSDVNRETKTTVRLYAE